LDYLTTTKLDGAYLVSIKTKQDLKLLPESNLSIRSAIWVLHKLLSALSISKKLILLLKRTFAAAPKKRYCHRSSCFARSY
jgi:hypothetical protein